MKHLVLIGLALSAACQGPSSNLRRPDPNRPLESAFAFSERPVRGAERAISATGTDSTITEFPDPALVDSDSTITIDVRPEALGRTGADDELKAELTKLETRVADMQKLSETLVGWSAARAATLTAFAATDEIALADLRGSQPFDDYLAVFEAQREFEEDLYSDLDTLFPDDHPRRPALEKLVNKKNAPGLLAALLEIFQSESQAIHGELVAARNARKLSLRMEAFLVGSAEGYDPVHIEHYDTLPQGQLRAVDRFQLDIDPAELRRMLQAYSDLAEAANKAKEEGGKLADVFAGVAPEFARRLGELEDRLKELLAADGENSLSARADATRASLVATRRLLELALVDAFDSEVARSWDAFQTQVVSDNAALLAALETLAAAAADFENLRAFLESPSADGVPAFVEAAASLAGNLRRLRAKITAVKWSAVELQSALEASLSTLEPAIRTRIESEWEGSPARVELRRWEDLIKESKGLVEGVLAVLDVRETTPLPDDVRVPEAFDVDLADVKDTRIDLRRTNRTDDSSLILRATLSDDSGRLADMEASFDVRRLGWKADWVPSLVLARPDQMTGTNHSTFAPSLSWLHTYVPRADDKKWFDEIFRKTGLAVGPHAVFVSFDPAQALEVGLGLTVSFWDGILQAGAGVNLMADDAQDGEVYYFIGSSLIPLLQSLDAQ